jgi:peptidoglycan hydrolase-like protein with peptidoglycan-binding domain
MRQAQSELKQQGLYGGPIDGVAGRQTRQAIADYQQQQGLPKTGRLDRQTMARLNGNQNQDQTAQQGNDQDRGIASGSSTPGSTRMSPDQLRSRLQAVGYTNVSNVHQVNDSTYAAQATRGGSTYALQLDAQSGRIVSQQQMGANNPPSNYGAPADARGAGPDDGTNSARSSGSTAQ